MKKSLILVSTIVVLAILVGCNADQISGFGKGLEKVGDLGLGTRNNESMTAAVENVKVFITDAEKDMQYYPSISSKLDGYLNFNDSEAKEAFVKTVEKTVDSLLAAKDSSANSKELRKALNAKYEGKNISPAYKIVYDGLSREPVLIGGLLEDFSDPERRANLVMILYSLMKVKVDRDNMQKIIETIDKLKVTEIPLPIQAGDYTMMIALLFPSIKSIVEAVKTASSGSGSGSERKINTEALTRFQRDIMKSVGNRDYQTVGDKIVVGIVFNLLYTVIEIDKGYQLSPEYTEAEEGHRYDNFFEYVFKNGKGLGYVDKMLNYLDAISYVYDVKLDLTGLVSGMV